MKRYVIDGNAFDGLESFYDHIGKLLCPGHQWGGNLDAFNDILWGGWGAFDEGEPVELIWKNSAKSKEDLGAAVTIAWLEDGLDRIHPSNRETWMERIAAVRRGKGQTLYEQLVEIIRDNPHLHFQEA